MQRGSFAVGQLRLDDPLYPAGADLGLEIHAGHGLTYDNVGSIAAIPHIRELNIGHFLIGEAIFVGLADAMARMRDAMNEART